MIKFDKPKNLNGSELLAELAEIGIILDNKTQAPLIDGNGEFWLDVKSKDATKAAEVVAAHNGTTIPSEPTIDQKLASVGLTIDDLKTALGL
jgi:hypothetical protein